MGLGAGFIGSIVVGLIAGWLAEKIMKRDDSLVTNLVVGVLGGLVGGGVLSLFGIAHDGMGWILMIVTATLGACLLLWIVGMIRGGNKQPQ